MLISCIIDGNYILSKLTFTLHKNNLLFGSLEQALENSILNYKKIYPFCDFYLVSDSKEKSWRFDYLKEYKASRKRDSDIDWKFVYSTYDKFKSKLGGAKIFEHPRVEGDDWISFLINKSNLEGKSCMVVSNDHDIKQLIKFDLDGMWLNFMSNEMFNKQKIFLPKNYRILVDKIQRLPNNDIFELNNNNEFLSMIKKFEDRHEIHEINNLESLMVKIISGDSSDNIQSVYQVNKGGKLRGIGAKGAYSIYEMYIQEFGDISLEDPDLYENIADIICEKKKLSKSMIGKIVSRIHQNMKLVDLRLHNFPDEIMESMNRRFESVSQRSTHDFIG
jgi:5'-3' exonuclease